MSPPNLEHLEHTTGGAKNPTALVSALRQLTRRTSAPSGAVVSTSDLSTPFVRSAEEEGGLVDALREAAREQGNEVVARADAFWLVACIRARKGDVGRAMALADNYLKWRLGLGADSKDLAQSQQLRAQLERRLVFVPGHVDRDGRPVLNVRLRYQDPSKFSAMDTARTLSFVVEWLLRKYPAAQTHGIVIVNDLRGVTLRNLDLRLPSVLQQAFSKTLPVRVAAINVINPPFLLKAVVGLFASVFSQKLKLRVRFFSKGDEEKLYQLIEPSHLVDDIGMGGTETWTDQMHREWIRTMEQDCHTWPACTLVPVAES
eukprot:GFKZ01005994.1.p1 GENE.GFKZ01005994.1~~GFKZ01005994.1.p1  ORF type:complete len:316 (+),score=43.96 GFKZ01005994.1:666-1613(+)